MRGGGLWGFASWPRRLLLAAATSPRPCRPPPSKCKKALDAYHGDNDAAAIELATKIIAAESRVRGGGEAYYLRAWPSFAVQDR